MSKEDFVSFEQAKRLAELGFDWNCNHYIDEIGKISENTKDDYNYTCYENLNDANFVIHDKSGNLLDYYSATTLSQACKWLRSKGFVVQVYINGVRGNYYSEVWQIGFSGFVSEPSNFYDTYEQAQSAGIDVALVFLEKGGE